MSTHGMSRTKVYRAYRDMLNRCYRKANKNYKDYGERGITVCSRWLAGFGFFYEDMGNPPVNHSLDRINSDGHYCKENCKWSTILEQNKNRRQRKTRSKHGFRGLKVNRMGLYEVRLNGKYVGSSRDKVEAARIYNKKAIELYGDKAILNEV